MAAAFLRHCAATEPAALRPGHRGFAPPGLGPPGTAGPGHCPQVPAAVEAPVPPRCHFGAAEPPGAPRALPRSTEWFGPPLAARPPPPAAAAMGRPRRHGAPPRMDSGTPAAGRGHGWTRPLPLTNGAVAAAPCRRGAGASPVPPCSARWAVPTAPVHGAGAVHSYLGGGGGSGHADPGGTGMAAGGGVAVWGEEPAPGPWLPRGCLKVTVYTA